jgi:hypothetical protein
MRDKGRDGRKDRCMDRWRDKIREEFRGRTEEGSKISRYRPLKTH